MIKIEKGSEPKEWKRIRLTPGSDFDSAVKRHYDRRFYPNKVVSAGIV